LRNARLRSCAVGCGACSVGWAKARERRVFTACCASIAPCPRVRPLDCSACQLRDGDRVGTARTSRTRLWVRRVLRAVAHPTAHQSDSFAVGFGARCRVSFDDRASRLNPPYDALPARQAARREAQVEELPFLILVRRQEAEGLALLQRARRGLDQARA